MSRTTRRLAAATVPVLAVLAGTAPGAWAAQTDLTGGSTTLRLDPSVGKALTGLGVRVTPTGDAKAGRAGIAFPITGGRINDATAAGRITHSGGLRFRAGAKQIRVSDFTLRTAGKNPTLSAKVNGGSRATIIRLGLGDAKLSRAGIDLKASGVVVRLSATGAKALNGTFGVHAFRSGQRLGRATVQATPATVRFTGGATSLALDPTTAGALTSLGVTPAPIAPATATAGGAIAFPITAGSAVNAKTLAGTIGHTGGLSLTAGATSVALTDFTITIDDSPSLSANVNGAGPVEILSLDVSALQGPTVSNGVLTLGNVVAKLTEPAATALNAAFKVSAFTPGLTLGTATVAADL